MDNNENLRVSKKRSVFLKVLLPIIAAVVALSVIIPLNISSAHAGELESNLPYEHTLGNPKYITDKDGKHYVYCINPNSEPLSGYTYNGNTGNYRSKYSGDMIYGPLKYNKDAGGGNHMDGSEWDQQFLASIIILGEEGGYGYDTIQEAVTDAVLNRGDKTGGGNELYEYAKNNLVPKDECLLFTYVHPKDLATFQSLAWAKRTVPVKLTTQAGTSYEGATRGEDGVLEVTIPEGEDTVYLGTTWDTVTYEGLKKNQNYAISVILADEEENKADNRDGNQPVSTGDSANGVWDGETNQSLQHWPKLSAGTYHFDIELYEIDGNNDYHLIKTYCGKNEPSEQIRIISSETPEEPTEPTEPTEPEEIEGTANIVLTKKIEGGNIADYSGKFSFKIEAVEATDAEGNAITDIPLPSDTEVENDAAGKIDFGTITYNTPGTYKYKVTEVVPEDSKKLPNVTYDTEPEIVTVTVTKTAAE